MCYNNDIISDKELAQLKTQVTPILKKYGVIRAGVFGSFARGEATKNSDVDFLVTIKNPKMGLLEFIGMQQEVGKKINRKVDIVEQEALKPKLKKYIMDDLIQIL